MVHRYTSVAKFLTPALIGIVLLSQFYCVVADLAPNEDEEDDVKVPELKRIDETDSPQPTAPTGAPSNLGFIHAFIASFSVIIVSEIGDKTFFIAAIMSMVSQYCHIPYQLNDPLCIFCRNTLV